MAKDGRSTTNKEVSTMSLKINTNIAALNAHRNMLKTDSGLSKSLERLSSGLRINKAADDASGMSIADSLKAQAMGLKQAIANANDGISVVQTADGALEEAVNIVNTIKAKAIQAASDGQSTDSRAAIQRDINKLLEEMQNIATTTSFNGLNLLDGSFSNKKFHIGAYSGETLSVSISSVTTNNVGAFASEAGASAVDTGHAFSTGDFTVNGVDVGASSADGASGANTTAHSAASAWAKVAAINSVSASTGVTATATTTQTGSAAITAGTIAAGALTINGIDIGAVTVSSNDADNSVVNAINSISNRTHVTASLDDGALVLTADDGSDIVLGGTTSTDAVLHLGDNSAGVTTGGTITLESANAITTAGTNVAYSGFTAKTINTGHTINSVDVSTNTLAELAITQADYALKDLDQVRSQLGSVQNQMESTVRNITITQVNVTSAESGIRDVDFAAESASFAKFQVLAQSGSFAMAQANASLQNVLRLLQ